MWSVYSWITPAVKWTSALSPTKSLIRCKYWQRRFCQIWTNFVYWKHHPHSWRQPLLHTLLRFLLPWDSNLPSLTWSVFLIIKSRCCCKNCSRSRCCFEISLSSLPFLSVRSITYLKGTEAYYYSSPKSYPKWNLNITTHVIIAKGVTMCILLNISLSFTNSPTYELPVLMCKQ